MVAFALLHLFNLVHVSGKRFSIGEVHRLQVFPVESRVFVEKEPAVLEMGFSLGLLGDDLHLVEVYSLVETLGLWVTAAHRRS